MYPNFINLRAEWLLSIRAPLSSNGTLGGGCLTAGGGGGPLSTSDLVRRFQATQNLAALSPMEKCSRMKIFMGRDSKIRPIFVLYERCIVIFFSCNLKIFALVFFLRFI